MADIDSQDKTQDEAGTDSSHSKAHYFTDVVAIVLIFAGTLIALAPAMSDYHRQTLVANTLPYLWSDAHRQGDDQPNQGEINTLEEKMDQGIYNGILYLFYFLLGTVMIFCGISMVLPKALTLYAYKLFKKAVKHEEETAREVQAVD